MKNNEKKDLLHRNLVVNKKVVMIALIALMISIIAPVGYAWFTSNVSGNSTAGVNTVATPSGLSLVLTDGPEVSGTNWVPGNSLEKTFTVKNNSATTLKYYVTLADLVNNFSDKTDLVYKLESSDGGYNMTSASEMIASSGAISELVTITSQATHTYKLTITFKYLDEDQSDNMGKQFSGKVNIVDENELPSNLIKLKDKIIALKNDGAIDLVYDGTESLGTLGTADNNLRYIGPKTGENTPKNYIYFNCSTTNPNQMNDETCEKWRIIGLFNNIEKKSGGSDSLIKIINTNSIGVYAWDVSDSSINGGYGINQWGESTYINGDPYEGADLMRELNTDYLGTITVGTDGKWYNASKNGKKNMPSSKINSNFESMIENVKWNLGTPDNDNGTSTDYTTITATTSYARERSNSPILSCSEGNNCESNVIKTNYWYGKIGLMYPSDFGYATAGGITTSKEICLGTSLFLWNSYSDCYNSWIFSGLNEWTITSYTTKTSEIVVLRLTYDGKIGTYNTYNSFTGAHPVAFLKSNVKIDSGEGTADSPYKLVLE